MGGQPLCGFGVSRASHALGVYAFLPPHSQARPMPKSSAVGGHWALKKSECQKQRSITVASRLSPPAYQFCAAGWLCVKATCFAGVGAPSAPTALTLPDSAATQKVRRVSPLALVGGVSCSRCLRFSVLGSLVRARSFPPLPFVPRCRVCRQTPLLLSGVVRGLTRSFVPLFHLL